MTRAPWTFVGIAVAAVLLGLAGQADARLIAADQFLIGGTLGIGEYAAGDLAWTANQNPTIPGFSGGWQNGTAATGQWDAATNGLQQGAASGTGGGRASYYGYGGGIRRVYRNLASVPSASTYYFHGLLRLDGDADKSGLSVGGFYMNNNLSDTTFFDEAAAASQEGLGWGFEGDGSQIDLVLRHRYDIDPAPGIQTIRQRTDTLVPDVSAGDTYRVIARLDMNTQPVTTGNDLVSVWINPADFTSEAAAGPPDLQFTDFSLSAASNIHRLVFASGTFGNKVSHDETRMATSWREAAALLYHNSFDGAQGTQPPGFTALAGTGMVSRNSGSSEYEQSRVSANGTALAAYSVADDVDRGAWRDVTAQAIFRYSGGSGNRNGLILRARDITGASDSTQDFYHVREWGGNVQLYRVNNGSFTLLDQMAIPGGGFGTANHLVEVSVRNILNAHNDHVAIRAVGYNGTTDGSSIRYELNYTDTSTDAITRAGGVGFRSYNTSNASSRSTYNDLRVFADNPRLLWYDDYSDGTAPRMQSFGKTVTTASRVYEFGGSDWGGVASIDFDSMTSRPEWENVEVSAIMRLHAAASQYSGILCRETGLDSSSSGDFYTYRISQPYSRAELWRVIDGSFSLLAYEGLSAAQMADHTDIFLKMFAETTPEGDVMLRGFASLDPDFATIYGDISYLDASASRILGPGSAGFRLVGGSVGNFDNFTVKTFHIPEPATMTLLGLGALGLILRRRRKP